MFHRGPAQPALGRPQDRFSESCCSCASCVLQGAARPPSLAALLFRLHSVACLSSLGPTVLFSMFSAFPDVDAKVCVCVCIVVGIRTDRIRLFLWTACHKPDSSRQNEHTWSNVAVRSLDSRSGSCVGVLLWVVVYAPTGPGASFSETPFF